MSAPTSDAETDTALRWLVTEARFVVVPGIDDEQLELFRWWTGGVGDRPWFGDRLVLRGEDDAELQRIAGVDPREPTVGRLVCRDRRSVTAIAAVVQAWGPPSPTSCPVVVRLSRADTPRPSITEELPIPAVAREVHA